MGGVLQLVGVGLLFTTAGCSDLLDLDGFSAPLDAGAAGAGGSPTGAGGANGGAAGAGGEAGGPLVDLRVFVTSTPYDGALGGLQGADETCSEVANLGDLTQGGIDWKAWLSGPDAGQAAEERFTANGRWLLTSGAVAFESRSQLFGGLGPDSAISSNEDGLFVAGPFEVWTGTDPFGEVSVHTCNGWTSSNAGVSGTHGNLGRDGADWTDDDVTHCGSAARLYCFETP